MKFKVWDKGVKMFVPDRIDCLINTQGILKLYNFEDIVYEPEAEDYAIYYSTGFTDKNGNEIYEGDIVKTANRELGNFYVVIFSDKNRPSIRRIATLARKVTHESSRDSVIPIEDHIGCIICGHVETGCIGDKQIT